MGPGRPLRRNPTVLRAEREIMMETPLENLDARIFGQHVRSKFRTQLGSTKVELELFSVDERDISPRLEAFCLLFHGPVSPRLPQQIYSVEHDKLGSFSLFLTAVAGDTEGISYEAVFNRYRKSNT